MANKVIKITGGNKIRSVLKNIERKTGSAKTLNVGFMAGAVYPDGTPVAMVAAIHNFGAPAAGIPARPFFSNMVDEKSPEWGDKLAKAMEAAGMDARAALSMMGEDISDDLRDSIVNGGWQKLSETTLMLRMMRSQDQGLKVTGKTVGQAAARVAAGEKHDRTESGSSPLVDTGVMLNKITYTIDDGEEKQ